jgi:cobalt-zinc-cadmium efflux system outer membrane protein
VLVLDAGVAGRDGKAMANRGSGWVWALACVVMIAGLSPASLAQAPTIEQTGQISSGISATPGSVESLLGPKPGAGANLGMQPGRDELLFGRLGVSAPRVPTSITMPGGVYQGPPPRRGIAAPEPLPTPKPPFYGTFELPKGPEEEGPPNGLTLDQAMDWFVHYNLELRGQFLEIPQAQADILTASLRANPILYADSQLVPYGSFNNRRPGGPTQYDLNISHPLDLSHKRQARMAYAAQELRVLEAQYQDAVRRGLNNLYMAYVDVLAARQTVIYAQVSVKGLDAFVKANEALYRGSTTPRPDVEQARSERAIATYSLLDAEGTLRQRKHVLAQLLSIPPDQAERLELRGLIDDRAPPPPPDDELIRIALNARPEVVAYRLGIEVAEANLKLARANRFADAYLLFQPFTYQNNEPFGKQSGTSWALGLTMPLPAYNRNQGNIERAKINIYQSQVQLEDISRKVIAEVQQAANEYRVSRQIVLGIRDQILPHLRRALADRDRLFQEGETNVFAYLEQTRRYNETAKAYLDSAVRHRKSMLGLNTAVGQRILP